MANISLTLALLAGLFASSCAYQKVALDKNLASEISANDAGKIPTSQFFAEPQYQGMKISPEGDYVATITTREGRRLLYVASPDMKKVYSITKFEGDFEVLSFGWVNKDRLYITGGDQYGNLDGRGKRKRIYFINFDGSKFDEFFGAKKSGNYAFERKIEGNSQEVVIVQYKNGAPNSFKINVYTGKMEPIDSFHLRAYSVQTDKAGKFNMVVVPNRALSLDATNIYLRVDGKMQKLDYPTAGDTAVNPQYYDEEKKELWLLSRRETGISGLYVLDMKTSKVRPIFVDKEVDVYATIPQDEKPIAVSYLDGRPKVASFDPSAYYFVVNKAVQESFPGSFLNQLNLTTDKKTGVFRLIDDRNPGDYYRIDMSTLKIEKIASMFKDFPSHKLGPRHPFTFAARDDKPVHAFVTLPPKAGMNDKLPMIVLVHGGPFGIQDTWFYDSTSQYFASRGYAVLQVNYRGSGGYGSAYEWAGHMQFGKRMQDDVTDATKWAISTQLADPQRICIVGGSYGGYAALQGVIKEADLYKCAVSIAGVSDLSLSFEYGDGIGSDSILKFKKKTMGDDPKELAAVSPAQHADKIKVPVFIIHGEDDVRVPLIHAERMRDALQKAGKPFQWLVKPYEGHGFTQSANRIEMYYNVVKFVNGVIGKEAAALPTEK